MYDMDRSSASATSSSRFRVWSSMRTVMVWNFGSFMGTIIYPIVRHIKMLLCNRQACDRV